MDKTFPNRLGEGFVHISFEFKRFFRIPPWPLDYYNSFNDNFAINLVLSKGRATSWLPKSTSATAFTMRNNREKLQGDAPLPPALMNIYSEKMTEIIGLNIATQEWLRFLSDFSENKIRQNVFLSWLSFFSGYQFGAALHLSFHILTCMIWHAGFPLTSKDRQFLFNINWPHYKSWKCY